MRRDRKKVIWLLLQVWISAWAIQGQALTEISWEGYLVDIPVIRYLFRAFQDTRGWGLESCFCMAGFFCLFWMVKKGKERYACGRQIWITVGAVLFAVGTVIGRSYMEYGNWNAVFGGGSQFLLAVCVAAGYFFLYENMLWGICLGYRYFNLNRCEAVNRLEQLFFERHPFFAPFLLILLHQLFVFIFFLPGTLQWDGLEEIAIYSGLFGGWSKHHPVFATWLIGNSFQFGREFFHNDSMGLFAFTAPQCIIQSLIFAYACFLISKKKASYAVRWFSLLYFTFFPAWVIWGITVVKDTYYYLFLLLFVLASVDIWMEDGRLKGKAVWKQVLLIGSGAAVGLFRSNGIYVMLLLLVFYFLFVRKHWATYLFCLMAVLISFYGINTVYAEKKGITEGEIGEALSIPVQQTARYLREHMAEVTPEERSVLEEVFLVSPEELAELYNPEISDPVKAEFVGQSTEEQLKDYFRIWLQQLKKHPDTYIQAFLNHTYGYYYPEKEEFWEGIGRYLIGNDQQFQYGEMEFHFFIKNPAMRNFYTEWAKLVYQMPGVGMFYSTGMQNYILILLAACLLQKRKWREIFILLPSLLTMLVCFVSPVNAYIRYVLPVMVLLPVNLAWTLTCADRQADPEGNISTSTGK